MIDNLSRFFLPSLVGRWSPRHVLQHPICLQGYSLPSIRGGESRASGAGEGLLQGGRGTETTVLLWFALSVLEL